MHNYKLLIGIIVLTGAIEIVSLSDDKPWPPPSGVPMTPWSQQVSPDKPVLSEYPRPQLARARWQSLNGLWEYAVTEKEPPAPTAYDGKILVPFAPQSVLSQVNKLIAPKDCIWYRRTLNIPVDWKGQRVLLHFGAVNWETHVWVNGKELGTHSGGYDGFSFDITETVTAAGPQELLVSAWNPIQGGQPRGKQALKPAGIFYTPTTGIWQTVWLEPVPQAHIENLNLVPDVDHSQLKLTVSAMGGQPAGNVDVVVLDSGKVVARAAGKAGSVLSISIPKARLWWPETPFLYDLKVTLKAGKKDVDAVSSYFGMRKISVGPDEKGVTRMLLNNKFVFQNGLLDQGFWPDGIYTAPTDEALRYDIEMTRKLGFNMTRKHIKVEPERWYYWADRLGLLVWQDMPSSVEMAWEQKKEFIPDREGQFERELRRMVKGRFNHPSIVVWVVFNEGWGLATKRKASPTEPDSPTEESNTRQKRMVAAVRQEDATRLISAESGAGGGANQGANLWDIGLGDIIDYHCYGKDGPHAEAHRAAVIGETGWGVSPVGSVSARLATSEQLGLSALVLTQLTDVENETNGALNYDRTLKSQIPLGKTGAEITDKLHQAGYVNYPGGESKPPHFLYPE